MLLNNLGLIYTVFFALVVLWVVMNLYGLLVLFELLCMAIIFLWYFVLPFCLMNPKGEKNSLVQNSLRIA